jgi:hypothetical protein
MKKYYLPVRALHLYIGLFISPFVLIYALSILVIDHPQLINKITPAKNLPVLNVKLDSIPLRNSDLLTARAILKKLDITGEVDYINKRDSMMSFPVKTPGKIFQISVNSRTGTATIAETDQGALRGTTYMHYMPGPHNAAVRGNSGFMKVWRYLVDTTIYSLLFLTVSGVFLWYYIKTERKTGIYSALIGVLVFIGLLLFTF